MLAPVGATGIAVLQGGEDVKSSALPSAFYKSSIVVRVFIHTACLLLHGVAGSIPPEYCCGTAGAVTLAAVPGAESLSRWASLAGVMGAGGCAETHRLRTMP